MGKTDSGLLKRFMDEQFAIKELTQAGFFKKGSTYEEMAARVCECFGYKTVYEYGAQEIRCHMTFAGDRPKEEKDFVTIIPNIYD